MVFLFEKNDEISTALDVYLHTHKSSHISSVQQVSVAYSFEKMQYEISRCF